jgi:uncharacterized protein
MTWKVKQIKNVQLKSPILIEGLPGIGNVGKVAVDFLVDELNAKRIYEIRSYTLPHSVFINEKNLVELPKIEIYHKKINNKDFLFLSGDVQPSDEVSCYEFSEKIVEICRKHDCKDMITLGGIGLMDIPKKPKLYCTGNTKKAVDKYNDKSLNCDLYGIVGPIVGVSGLLLGMADKDMNAIAILAETYGHPMYLGVKGAKEILKFLKRKFRLKVDIEKLEREIKDIEEDIIKKTEELSNVSKQSAADKLKKKIGGEVNYIG